MTFTERLQHAWNVFRNKDPTYVPGYSYSTRPDRTKLRPSNERTLVNAIYNRIAMDASDIKINHVRIDENGNFVDIISSGLNNAISCEANIDQTSRAFFQDFILSMFDEGVAAMVPVDTTVNPTISNSYEINTLRTGKIVQWFPEHVRVRLYNDREGRQDEVTIPKKMVAIVENPFYSVMNEPNSILKRLVRKLNLLDAVDEQSSAGKLDLIIQLPYVVKTEARRAQAEQRRKDIEMQLAGSKYGIAYTDGTEHITQLNRSLDNNLMNQITYLTDQLYSQLGLTAEIMNGTADEQAMLNYQSRTIEPILSAIADEMKRKFLTKTARSQKQSIMFFKDPFKLVSVNNVADIADKFTRNEVLTPNEVRGIIGFKPSQDPKSDELRNRNINESDPEAAAEPEVDEFGNPIEPNMPDEQQVEGGT